MSGLRFVFKTLSLLRIITMLFIWSTPNCGFVRESSEDDKIKKTLQTMLPSNRVLQHQSQAQNYQHYVNLIRDLL
jgi:hypothetical protein